MKELKVLKGIRTKLLNKKCETKEEFEEIQNKLNEVELEMMLIQNEKHIPNID